LEAFVVKTPLVRAVYAHITDGGFTGLPREERIRSFLLRGGLRLIIKDFHHFYVEHVLHSLFQLLLGDIRPDLAMQDEVEFVTGTSYRDKLLFILPQSKTLEPFLKLSKVRHLAISKRSAS
jgi:hypothetical protein